MNGSYQLNSFTRNKESEVKRLKAQVELFFEKEFENYKKLGLQNGMKILECGSGPGYLILNILRKFPGSDATALEIDPYLYEILEKNSEQEGQKLFKTIRGSIYDTGLNDNSFDIVITRLVIEHLEDTSSALKELRRIIKPGGKLIVVSNDFAYHLLTWPVIPELDEMYSAYCRQREAEGGNAMIGRQMPVILEKAGFDEVEFEVVTAHSKLKGDDAFLKAENVNISKSLVEEGYLSKDTLANLVEKWFAMLKNPDHVLYRQLFMISGQKSVEEKTDHATNSIASSNFRDQKDVGLNDELAKQKEKFQKLMNKTRNSSISKNSSGSPITEKLSQKSPITQPEKEKLTADKETAGNTEKIVMNIWKEILNNEKIDPDDNYFDIGGDSVLIPDIVSRLSDDHNIHIRILDLFEYPTVRQLAGFIKSKN